jgi:hypothetical protein
MRNGKAVEGIFIYCLFPDVVQASNDRISESLTGKDVEESGRGLLLGKGKVPVLN